MGINNNKKSINNSKKRPTYDEDSVKTPDSLSSDILSKINNFSKELNIDTDKKEQNTNIYDNNRNQQIDKKQKYKDVEDMLNEKLDKLEKTIVERYKTETETKEIPNQIQQNNISNHSKESNDISDALSKIIDDASYPKQKKTNNIVQEKDSNSNQVKNNTVLNNHNENKESKNKDIVDLKSSKNENSVRLNINKNPYEIYNEEDNFDDVDDFDETIRIDSQSIKKENPIKENKVKGIDDGDTIVIKTPNIKIANQATQEQINRIKKTKKNVRKRRKKKKSARQKHFNQNNNNNKRIKESRPKAKKSTFIWAIIVTVALFLGLCLFGGFCYFVKNMCKNIPDLSAADLDSSDSSIIYDIKGNQIIELGLYLRENVEYDSLPNCVVDAFLSIEDSRFFDHFGFDLPRFTRALLENIKTRSFGQGGSTMTMQLVKLSYFQIDDGEDSTMASRSGMSGIQRKIQEIVLSLETEQLLSKKEILSLYLNKVNFGDNIRGIQKASEYYFGKDVSELSLNESAFLAGIVNAPNGNNPYNSSIYQDLSYLNNANDRKNEVLDLMQYHGYISKSEAELNKKVKIENLVVGKNSKFKETNTYYQSFIDAVINEAQKVTGKNPYTTAMNIYTSMDPYMQEYVYNMQNNPEMFSDKYEFRHDDQQNALVVLNNQTGELIALGGGRNQVDKARQFNRAVDSYINPGSSIKPVLEYCLAFDRLGYATSHTICDKPIFLYETDIAIANAYGQGYTGDMQLTEALARSLNTPAVQLMDDLLKYYEKDENYENPEDAIIEYCQAIGFDSCDKNTFDIQWAIGGKDCLVSPVQLAGAHGMLINGGKYVVPHTIKRIEYRGKYNETPDYIADTEGTQVVSEEAAYLTAYLEKNNVDSGWIPQLNLLKRKYPVYAKTGTTNFSESAYVNYDIPESAAKDQWLCTQTSNYTIVVWNGFDKLADGAYFTVKDENYNLKCKMGSLLLDALMEHFEYDAPGVTRPEGVIDIQHILGCFPYAKGSSAKGLISKNSPYATPIDESEIKKELFGGTLYHMGSKETAEGLLVHWDEFNAYTEDGRIDTTATSVSGNTTIFASGRSYYQRYNFVTPGMFYATITAASGEVTSVESPYPTTLVPVAGVGPFNVCGWTATNPKTVCGSSRSSDSE